MSKEENKECESKEVEKLDENTQENENDTKNELQKEWSEQKAKMKALEESNADLLARLETLEKRVIEDKTDEKDSKESYDSILGYE